MKWKYHLFELMLVIGLLNADTIQTEPVKTSPTSKSKPTTMSPPTTIALSTSNDLMLTNSNVPAPIIQKDRCNVFKTIILHMYML